MKYIYECPGDGEPVYIERSISAPEQDYACPRCGAKMRRVYESPPVHFRTNGFYSTDK